MTLTDGAQGLAFGPLLRRYRLSAGMTQQELAGASTLSVRAIGDLERGRTGRPQRKSVELLAGALAQGDEAARRLVEAARAARLAPEHDGSPEERPGDGNGTAAHAVRADGDRAPGTRAPGAPVCELPPDIPDFTARQRELLEIEGALAPEGVRCGQRLTLIAGHPGAGKTALAVRAAHRLRSRFPDGQLFVQLSPAGHPALGPDDVVRHLLRSLGDPAAGAGPAEEAGARLRAVLARERVLIVLDDAVSEGQVRCACPGVGASAVLATCRRRLSALPGAGRVDVGAFGTEEALAFLARMVGEERVRRERAEAALVAELCGRIPLALRVVGCRLLARPHWTMRTLVDEVLNDPRTRLRELGSGDLTVRAAVAAAFGVLDEQTRWALRRLAAARAPGFSLRGAATLLGCGTARTHRILGDLMDGHLLEAFEGRRAAEPSYVVPPVIRLFALEGAEAAAQGSGALARSGPARA
ncbi:NB-ARC domain-containing protein [Streptomyces sp. UNOB3_S3]|uniref:NB-ARC domain-containing protein n=1 Tax=Streptomyces sp. UNOB3_S3 TaxID=2871682 RepID=UPI001E4956A0|nr:NB-ARC domain-containing protein [Streptomyces sp. UNOB3_S3]MCC3775645.1 helix-turn-helix domain-containing protein [Streptomyces sp. UNOB3_S3]